ncbi:MAG TPA: cysteine--tRNA ligase [Anaerolinea thermolimosa]|uniref:Cysteine--tRNA ligase n=1 Tax=Anaerolinea thermolimosa TaxID=229919 RepID=A0A3D1JEH2_9CHLR|nr:cysteine--tRNA ligase [Anaerolinea thermolimosa]GAP05534.1 cysteinyl-tRNA synthetase [Anaerolinea thermolimosa]HCE16991.1 cysteine--tRNA ligase [Anaerolinea thermolimosa]
MGMKIYNTLTRKKEDFETLEPGKVRMYVCGPTVYNKAHVGHAMSALVFDIIRRYLMYRGYDVTFVMNFTDVDDKIILRANQLGVDPFELAEGYIEEYRRQLEQLNVLPATFNPRATQTIPQIIAMVQGLIEKGYAYPANGDVYFRVRRDEDYGRLSGRRVDEMQSGARIEIGEHKEDPLDFALWKAAKPGEPAWDSPWGPGRPGWHIECSAMNLTHLGEQIDIHGGGNDLIFPHHENEIAQTESFTGKPFARYWVHNGMLQLGGEKMSKSLGNLVTIEEFLREHDADVLRLMVLNSGYRNPLTFNDEVIEQTERTLERLKSALRPALPGAKGLDEESARKLTAQAEETREGFIRAMDDDFNSAVALSHLFELVRAINQARTAGAIDADLQVAQGVLRELAGVLGLRLQEKTEESHAADPFIDLLVEVRTELRKQKLWALSDLVRDRLAALGVILEDSKEGTTWRYQK